MRPTASSLARGAALVSDFRAKKASYVPEKRLNFSLSCSHDFSSPRSARIAALFSARQQCRHRRPARSHHGRRCTSPSLTFLSGPMLPLPPSSVRSRLASVSAANWMNRHSECTPHGAQQDCLLQNVPEFAQWLPHTPPTMFQLWDERAAHAMQSPQSRLPSATPSPKRASPVSDQLTARQ
jgi:hypothetical protein